MTNCPVCGSELKTIPAGVSKKTGKPYQSFTACPNKCKTSWNQPPQPQNGGKVNMSDKDPMIIIGDELGAMNKRLDGLAEYLKSKLG